MSTPPASIRAASSGETVVEESECEMSVSPYSTSHEEQDQEQDRVTVYTPSSSDAPAYTARSGSPASVADVLGRLGTSFTQPYMFNELAGFMKEGLDELKDGFSGSESGKVEEKIVELEAEDKEVKVKEEVSEKGDDLPGMVSDEVEDEELVECGPDFVKQAEIDGEPVPSVQEDRT
jgi:hypothetical protein